MGKKTVFTNITPLPPNVSREVAIAMLHNHDEMIELNPLVIEHHPIQTPRDAAKDEFLDCAWQEMTDRIALLPGGVANRRVTYRGCFHNTPTGLQTHVYAPMGLDIRERWTIGGSLPGEPDEPRELGLTLPRKGLYLREDGEMRCNMLMTNFVRKNLDNSHKTLVERILAKAERVQAHLDSTASTPTLQRGSHMDRSNIVRQLSEGQHSRSISQGSRQDESRSPLKNANTQYPYNQPHRGQHMGFAPRDSGNGQDQQPSTVEDAELDEAELQAVHPAMRDDYRRSRQSQIDSNDLLPAYNKLKTQQGQFYQNDLAKRPQGKQFAVELEGSTASVAASEKQSQNISYHAQTTYGPTNEVDDDRIGQPLKIDDAQLHRYSTVSAVSGMPTPNTDQSTWNTSDPRFSMISALSEDAPTPRMSQQTFSHQQAFGREQARLAQAGVHRENMF